jgi:hypothetical protein
MGEIAEMMLEGILCEGCGEVFDDVIAGGEGPGHPRRCRLCDPSTQAQSAKQATRLSSRARRAARHNRDRHEAARERKPFECNRCQKLFRSAAGLEQHTNVKHGEVRK